MPSAPVATATVKIVPDVRGFTKSVRAAIDAMLLSIFMRWLEQRGYLKDGLRHDAIVDQFIADQAELEEARSTESSE